MEGLFPVAIVVISSAGCFLAGSRTGRWTRHALWPSVCRMLESVGMGALCFLLNMCLGMGLILAVRSVTPWFVPIYLMSDVLILALSFLQGLMLCMWWHGGPEDSIAPGLQ